MPGEILQQSSYYFLAGYDRTQSPLKAHSKPSQSAARGALIVLAWKNLVCYQECRVSRGNCRVGEIQCIGSCSPLGTGKEINMFRVPPTMAGNILIVRGDRTMVEEMEDIALINQQG